MSNRLAHETSPYLQQHKNNPVDWYPWGQEALERAKRENKPILLSVGYSACHWCHVMEHESFENADIARLMNDNFVNIKVDREERPDLDQIYQNVAQAITRGGGWPLTVFLTPDLKPFFGGTYFPPEDRYGRPGFPRILDALSRAYREDPSVVAENARRLTEFIQSTERAPEGSGDAPPSREALAGAASLLLGHVDRTAGGFEGAPKFPNPMSFIYLWRMGDPESREATLVTLRKMAEGGIYDQLGGGFSRYSVDATWSVPHFEKMLYDNALLLKLYSEVLLSDAISVDDRKLFTRVVRETVDYVLREMTSPEGAFYSAQDADSEGEEGKFFVWDPEDLASSEKPELTDAEAHAVQLRYGVTSGGNFEHGKTVLFLARTVDQVATAVGKSASEVEASLESARHKLFERRERRVKPGLDDKVLASWNGLMISGLAWASQALGEPKALAAARRAFDFLKGAMAVPGTDGARLHSTYKAGKARLNAYLDDYAFLAQAAIDLARFDTREADLELAARWVDTILRHFSDPSNAGYYFTSDDHEQLLQRPKTVLDQAIPSGTAVTLGCLSVLSEMDVGGRASAYAAELAKQLPKLLSQAVRNPYGSAEILNAAALELRGPIVLSGPAARELVRESQVFVKPGDSAGLLVCQKKACFGPFSDIKAARAEIDRLQRQ